MPALPLHTKTPIHIGQALADKCFLGGGGYLEQRGTWNKGIPAKLFIGLLHFFKQDKSNKTLFARRFIAAVNFHNVVRDMRNLPPVIQQFIDVRKIFVLVDAALFGIISAVAQINQLLHRNHHADRKAVCTNRDESVQTSGRLSCKSEIGVDMVQFGSSKRLCCWAGLTPGNNESAGKKKSVRISRAGVYLKPALAQVAHAAVKGKLNPYYALKYERIAKRRGKKRAIIAIARMILTAIYSTLSTGEIWNPVDLFKVDMPEHLKEQQLLKALKHAVRFIEIQLNVS